MHLNISAQQFFAMLIHERCDTKSSSKIRFELIADDVGVAQLPAFAKKPQAITDGHLFELARKNSMQLVTFDQGIPIALHIR